MDQTVRVRFAPSPTGHLHVGGARTAIFNWLFARGRAGRFILRVEDTDQERSTRESEAMVLGDLRWLGLDWDEGPDVGGPHGPYRQSERKQLYQDAARSLVSTGHAYLCFCLEEDLEARRVVAEAEGRPPHYDLTCFRLPAAEVERRVRDGMPAAIRFHVPKEPGASFDADVTIHDLIRGEVTWKKESLGDFILVRSDGMPTYNFSCVVDDHDMAITHVIRAEEHLTNTQRQVLLYRAFGWDVPQLAHVSLILGEDRTKLSKRHGATSVSAWAEDGFLPEAMVNYLALLGWSSPDGQEIFDRASAIRQFALDRVNPAPAVFDAKKLTWMNGEYIRAMSGAELTTRISGLLRDAGLVLEDSPEALQWFGDAFELVKTAAERLPDLVTSLAVFFSFDAAKSLEDAEVRAAVSDQDARRVLECLAQELRASGQPATPEEYTAMVERLKTSSGQKGKKLFMPVRVALTGSLHGPELQRAIPLMTRGSRIEGLRRVVSPEERVAGMLAALGG